MPTLDEVITKCGQQQDFLSNQLGGKAVNGVIKWHDNAGIAREGKPEEAIKEATDRLAPMKSNLDLMWERRLRQYAVSMQAQYSEAAITRETKKLEKLGLSEQLRKFLLAADPFVQKRDQKTAAKAGDTVLEAINKVREGIDELPGELLPDLAAATQAVQDRLNAMQAGQRDPATQSSAQRMVQELTGAVTQSIADSETNVLGLNSRFMESDGVLSAWWGIDLPKEWADQVQDRQQAFTDASYATRQANLVVDTITASYSEFHNVLAVGYGVARDHADTMTEGIVELAGRPVEELVTSFEEYNARLDTVRFKPKVTAKNVLDLRQSAWRTSEVLANLDGALEGAWFGRSGTPTDFWQSKDPGGCRDRVLRSFLGPKAAIRAVRERLQKDMNFLATKAAAV
jgi:hypothetical protein